MKRAARTQEAEAWKPGYRFGFESAAQVFAELTAGRMRALEIHVPLTAEAA